MKQLIKSNAKEIKIVSLFMLLTILFFPVLKSLISVWNTNDDYSHGFFVIPIFIYMVWQKKDFLYSLQVKPSWVGFVFLLVGMILYTVAFLTNFHTLIYLSIMIIIISTVVFLAGWQITYHILFPVLFLLFMFPIPSSVYIQITSPLKVFITNISAYIISLVGIPVYQEGNLLYFAKTQLEVAEACSGIRSLFSYAMLSCVFSLFCTTMTRKVIIILSTIPLAIAVNIVRVSGTGILAHFFGEKAAQGFFHEFTGFFLFAIGLVFLFSEYYFLESRVVTGKITDISTDPK